MTEAIADLFKLRAVVSRLFVPWLWLHVPVCALGAWASGNAIMAPAVAAALVAGAASAAWAMSPAAKSTRLTIGVAYIGEVSILLAACRGSLVQIDLHMYYFAALAILVALCDREVIVAGAGVTALHHLGLNFVAPALVFPDGANLPRVILHAVIVILETAALVWVIDYILKILEKSGRLVTDSEAALRKAQAAEERAAALREAADVERQAREAALQSVAREQELVVTAVGAGLTRLASGQLHVTLENAFPAGYEKLRADFNAAVQTLEGAFRAMLRHTGAIHVGTDEIRAATDDLATRTEQQAAFLEETSSSLASVTEAVQLTANRAARTREVVAAASGDTERSGTVVAEAVAAMGRIAGSSGQIQSIVGVIEDIAFQTNLLALNAGVEAARAGDAGRGFAVVAMEVRALAQRSADAAKEIKALIQTSENEVRTGVDRVGVTGQVLQRLTAQVVEIDKMIDEISVSTGKQAETLGGVNEAMSRMEQSTQRTAAMVEETNAATQSLAGEARALNVLSARFELGPESATGARAVVPRAASAPVLARG